LQECAGVFQVDDYVDRYLKEVQDIARQISKPQVEKIIGMLAGLREKDGRLFFLGVGGGAGNATHAVNDFRKIAGIETYTPTDNVSELTARVNDQGWATVLVEWLKTSKLSCTDAVFVFSVGGGSEEKGISINIVNALKHAKEVGAKVFGIVGRDGGYTAKAADVCVVIPTISSDTVTAHTESFQAVLWHLIVSHPKMRVSEMKWESVK
jgi:D-sedoheptulose 7-phosphate isomerase